MVQTGATGEVSVTVGESDTAAALGSGDVRVLGTPRVVALVEAAAVRAIGDGLESDMTSVGTHIDLEHLAPSPVGAVVVATAQVVAVEGRRISLSVRATMDAREVARGTHARVVVRRAGFGEG